MGGSVFRRLTCFGGSLILGSTIIDLMRFTPWQNNHDILVPILVLAGLAAAYCIGWLARSILK